MKEQQGIEHSDWKISETCQEQEKEEGGKFGPTYSGITDFR